MTLLATPLPTHEDMKVTERLLLECLENLNALVARVARATMDLGHEEVQAAIPAILSGDIALPDLSREELCDVLVFAVDLNAAADEVRGHASELEQMAMSYLRDERLAQASR